MSYYFLWIFLINQSKYKKEMHARKDMIIKTKHDFVIHIYDDFRNIITNYASLHQSRINVFWEQRVGLEELLLTQRFPERHKISFHDIALEISISNLGWESLLEDKTLEKDTMSISLNTMMFTASDDLNQFLSVFDFQIW